MQDKDVESREREKERERERETSKVRITLGVAIGKACAVSPDDTGSSATGVGPPVSCLAIFEL